MAQKATYLISRFHEDIISDFPKGKSKINDIILCAASFREIADVYYSAFGGFPLWELRGINVCIEGLIIQQLGRFLHKWDFLISTKIIKTILPSF